MRAYFEFQLGLRKPRCTSLRWIGDLSFKQVFAAN